MRLTNEQKEEIKKLFNEQHLPLGELAGRYKVSKLTITNSLKTEEERREEYKKNYEKNKERVKNWLNKIKLKAKLFDEIFYQYPDIIKDPQIAKQEGYEYIIVKTSTEKKQSILDKIAELKQ